MASLVADYGTSGSENNSSSESADSDLEIERSDPQEKASEKLPLPSFSESVGAVKNSVFVNPYVEAEKTKLAVLEKHVKMVPQKKLMSKINGKKVCWMYRKGRCRFGHTCKFAHDSDLIATPGTVNDKSENASVVCSGEFSQGNLQTTKRGPDASEELSETPVKKKKKKPGLTQGLVPGKKVMKVFKKSTTDLLAP